jgi:DNA-binding transcriptional LysR family regulator
MELREMRYVQSVARHANFTRAADELHVAQPALSAAVRRLEAELGVRLFERTSRRVRITDAGIAFLDRAGRLIAEADELAAEMHGYAGGVRGRLRLSAWYHVEPQIADFLHAFITASPSVEVVITEEPSQDALARLRSGDLDLALIALTSGLDLSGLRHRVMKSEPYVFVTTPDHRLAERDSVEAGELLQESFVVTRERTALRRCFQRAFADFSAPPRIVIETDELAAIAAYVSIGLGNAILTRSIAEHLGVRSRAIAIVGTDPMVLAAAWAERPHGPIARRAVEIAEAVISAGPRA